MTKKNRRIVNIIFAVFMILGMLIFTVLPLLTSGHAF